MGKSMTNNFDMEIISWEVPEYDTHERSRNWYILAALVGVLLLVYSVITSNFLFAGIVVIAALVIILTDGKEAQKVRISLTDDGVEVGRKIYDYDEIKDFAIVYKPKQGVKNLYFEFKTITKPRLSIPLLDRDPLIIRDKLLKYLQEDLERTEQPLSEGLAKMFKL
jgi:hypothetical protein